MKMPLRYLHRSSGEMQLSMDANTFDLLNHDCSNNIENNKSNNDSNKDSSYISNNEHSMCNKLQRLDSYNLNKIISNYKSSTLFVNKYDYNLDSGKSLNSGQAQLNELDCNEKCSMPINNNSSNLSDCAVSNCEKFSFVPMRYINNDKRITSSYKLFKIVLVTLIGCLLISSVSSKCTIIDTGGETWPSGDIIVKYGDPLRILCFLNETYMHDKYPNKNASDLVFYRDSEKLDKKYITIINESTAELFIRKPQPSNSMYYCNLLLNTDTNKKEAICLNRAVVGFPPQKPENFTCTSYNWDYMICTWNTIPNIVKTTYTLSYKLVGPTGDRRKYSCPMIVSNSCYWNISTYPIYRQVFKYYMFNLTAVNVLGSLSMEINFNHHGNVIPANPVNLTTLQRTSNSALLYWSIPVSMQSFPPGIYHKIKYKCQYSENNSSSWKQINITDNPHESKKKFNLTGLKYAYAIYDVRVYMRSAEAIDEDSKWSNFSATTFRTMPSIPGKPPKTDIGSFSVVDPLDGTEGTRKVYLYWQTIPIYLENSDGFKYLVTQVKQNGKAVSITPNNLTRTYAVFSVLSSDDYVFEIQAINSVGFNLEKAIIHVPKSSNMPSAPGSLTKIEYNGLLYGLSWTPSTSKITNYTIFWCNSDHLSECNGVLNWIHIPGDYNTYNVTMPNTKVYQFAIAANNEKGSSGLVWAQCTVINNRIISKMRSVWISRIESDYIDINWKLDCSERTAKPHGYNISYCPIVSPHNSTCRSAEEFKFVTAKNITDPYQARISSLIPYTTYMISVSVVTENGQGKRSNPHYKTTLEAAPSVPLNIKVVNVTNTTVTFSWDPPVSLNGVLSQYKIRLNGTKKESQKKPFIDHNLKEPQIRKEIGLLPFMNYSIEIQACNSKCSKFSKPVNFITSIGAPTKIMKSPLVRFVNSSQVHIVWNKPIFSGGNLNYYQISSSVSTNLENVKSLETKLSIPDCKLEGRGKRYEFKVRAVNINPEGYHFFGPWSETGEGNCFSDGPSFEIWIAIWVISSICGIAFLLFLSWFLKHMWFKCKAMQDVEVRLPPGLAREKLLQKMNEQHTRQLSADSSGCSSGQESVTSSLTSESHISTDSGTEADSLSPNKLLESSNNWETSSLRQRNVINSKIVGLSDSRTWDPCAKISKPDDPNADENLSLTKSTPNLADNSTFIIPTQNWTSTGYISMPSSNNPNSSLQDISNIGCYSIVGVNSNKKDVPNQLLGDVVFNYSDAKINVPPYVSLASIEQKPKQNSSTKLVNSTNVGLLKSNKTSKIEPSIPALDQSSKPYVKTGLINNLLKQKSPFKTSDAAMNNPNSIKLKPTYTDSVTKPYVTIASIQEINKNVTKPVQNISDDKQKQNQLAVADKPYVQASSIFQVLKEPNTKVNDNVCTEEDKDDKKSLSKKYPNYWETDDLQSKDSSNPSAVLEQKSLDNVSSLETKDKQGKKGTSSYVQHHQLEKQLLTSANLSSKDEQYSKVAVAPSEVIK